jgi:hypothetical protein
VEDSAVTSVAFRALTSALAAAVLAFLATPPAVRAADPYQRIVVATPSPYWGYVWNPYADALHGIADIYRAQGDFLVLREKAIAMRLETRYKQLALHKAELEHCEWVRDFRLNWTNRAKESQSKSEIDRSRNLYADPSEIFQARPLNSLYDKLRLRRDLPTEGSTPVEADWLSHINTTVVDGRGNAGLLKLAKLPWPTLLRQPEFRQERERINELFQRARELQLSTERDSDALFDVVKEMRGLVNGLQTRLPQLLQAHRYDPDWGARYYGEATTFVREQLPATVMILEKDDQSFLLQPLQGKTVAELVQYMAKKGVRFAPATKGGESHYIALHLALAKEVNRLLDNQPTANRP